MTGLGEALETVRRSKGLTQEQLAVKAGVTQAALSRYENGLREPDQQALARVAEALGVTADFLSHAGRARAGMAVDVHMRRRATAPPGVWRQLEALLNVYRWHVSHLFEEVSMRADHRVPTFDPLEVDPADAARIVRAQWRMPVGPVRSFVRWLEAAGCVLILEDFGTSRVDGLSQWVDDHPVILYNDISATDRVRLTLAHELGHLVLHSNIEGSEDLEAEANAFAAEFLMPADIIRPSLKNLKISRLIDLKREWGVSMQALVERAYGLDLLGPSQRTSLYKMFSAKGWRVREPGSADLSPERPELPQEIARALLTRGLTSEEVAEIAGFNAPHDNSLFQAGGLHAV